MTRQPYVSVLLYGAAAVVAALAGFIAVYVTLRAPDNAGKRSSGPAVAASEQATALPSGPGANPLSTGDMAAFVFKKTPEPLAEIAFQDGEGRERSLKEWHGRVVLLNFWATWCAPCRKEMPALDRLQAALGSDKFEVVALAADRAGLVAARKFLDQTKVERLALYADPTARTFTQLKAVGMPTTLLIDAEGREIGRLVGPAEWDSADAKRLIAAAIR